MVKQLILCLALSSLSWATCGTVVQHKVNAGCASGSACAVTVTSTGSGHILVASAAVFNDTNLRTISTVSAGGTFTHCSNCETKDTGNDYADISYTLNSTSGVTSISVSLSGTLSAGASWVAGITEFSCTGTPAFDVSGSNADTTCTTCAGHTLALNGSSDAIFQVVSCGQTCSAVTSPYSTNQDFPSGNGMASAAGQSSGTAPNWTQAPTGVVSVASIAFNDAVAACTPTLTLMGVGRCG